MTTAKFDIDDDGKDHGFEFALGTTSDLKLRADPALDVQKTTFELFARIDGPDGFDIVELPYQTKVATSGPTSPLTITWPVSTGIYAFLIRCQINDGERLGANGQPEVVPEWTWEREAIYRLPSGQRPVCPSEQTQFDQYNGWTSAINDMAGAWGVGTVVGPNPSTIDAVATYGNGIGSTLLNNPLVRVLQTTGKVLLGANPPSGAGINLSNAQGVHSETVAPSAGSAQVLAVDPSNDLLIGENSNLADVYIRTKGGQQIALQIGAITKLAVTGTLVSTPNSLAIDTLGTGAATVGDVRLSKTGSIFGRNNALDNNVSMLSLSTDVVVVGDSTQAAGVALITASGSITANIGVTTELTVSASKVLVANELEVDGTFNHDGANYAVRNATPGPAASWTVTNGSTLRTFDADSVTINELADVVATMISDDVAQGHRA
jgi:hypothetical protein